MSAEGDVRSALSAPTIVAIVVLFGGPMGAFLGYLGASPVRAIGLGLGAGVLFAGMMAFVITQVGRGGEAERELFGDPALFDASERLVREGLANHFKGVEGVGGKLFLTDQRVRFISHQINVQTHDESYPLGRIETVEATRTLGIIPNGLLLTHSGGKRERFVVYRNKAWAESIRKAVGL